MGTKRFKANQTLNFNRNLFLLAPILFVVHNFEEALTIAEWSQKIPEFIRPEATSIQFSVAVTLLSVIGIAATIIAKYMFRGRYFINIMCGFSAVLIINAFFPHILAAVYFKSYVPGLITSIFLYLPFCSYAFFKVLNGKVIGKKDFILSFLIGTLSGVVLAKFALYIGEQF